MNEIIGPIYYVLANDSDPVCQGNYLYFMFMLLIGDAFLNTLQTVYERELNRYFAKEISGS